MRRSISRTSFRWSGVANEIALRVSPERAVRRKAIMRMTDVLARSPQQCLRKLRCRMALGQIVEHVGIKALKRRIQLGSKRQQKDIALETA